MPARVALAGALFVIVVHAAGGVAARQQVTVPQSALGALAAMPEARTVWSRLVGDVRSPGAYLLVSAVEVEAEDRAMRGVRLEPRHDGEAPACSTWPYMEWQLLCEQEHPSVYVEAAALPDFIEDARRGAANVAGYTAVSRTRSRSADGITRDGYVILGYVFEEEAGSELVNLLTQAHEELQQRPQASIIGLR